MVERAHLVEAHRPRWAGFWVWLGLAAGFYLLLGILAWTFVAGYWWLTVPLVLLTGHVMHGHLLAYHDASHGTLCPDRRLNEACGIFVGVHALVPLALYRFVHYQHHVYLTSERDEEFWPFTDPRTSRSLRQVIAFLELVFGFFYTPFLFLRCFLRPGSPIVEPRLRRRIWMELALMAVYWTALLTITAHFGWWPFLAVLFLAPAVVAGNLQSWRKYIEHMGLTGTTLLSTTRSVVPTSLLGRAIAFTMFNIAYHGVHHKYARMHETELPSFTEMLAPAAAGELPPYPSYHAAIWDMLRNMADPRVGVQWLTVDHEGSRPRLVRIGKTEREQRLMAT